MDIKKLKEMKYELEVRLISEVAEFETETGVPIAAIKIQRIDTSTLEGKSNLLDSLEVVLTL